VQTASTGGGNSESGPRAQDPTKQTNKKEMKKKEQNKTQNGGSRGSNPSPFDRGLTTLPSTPHMRM
jgi:hypothetical protein